MRTGLAALLLAISGQALAADEQIALARIDRDATKNIEVANQIWSWAEVGFQEIRSSALLQKQLKAAGFRIESGVAGMPTAFTATWGSGGPVIAILGEFDALPGFSQAATPDKQAVAGMQSGHACGHHLFGAASMSAAIAIKDWLQKTGRPGTVRFYGAPAEEGGSGKVYLVRAGLFKDVDTVLHWHPGAANNADATSNLANVSGTFRFKGKSAHASVAPERGRSALDGVEAMDVMVNMMREHVPSAARIHYVITKGGEAPNVVPDDAEVYYYVRHPDPQMVREIFDRVVKASEGAAMGTGTTVTHEITGGSLGLLPNVTLQKLVHQKMTEVGGVTYTPAELAFAEKLSATLGANAALTDAASIKPFAERPPEGGSTDVGDVSWTVPTAGFDAATWVPGTAAHSWQAAAAGGMSIGWKGMQNAAKILALSAIALYENPELIKAAKAEFATRRGANFVYQPLIGDRAPALDYRKKAH